MFEDFVPISGEQALVTLGPSLRTLSHLALVNYAVSSDIKLDVQSVVAQGSYLRLGHLHSDGLLFSDGWDGPHQPFYHAGSLYYSDDAPTAKLYRDGHVLIADGAETGNPWIDGDTLYYETRRSDRAAPQGWEVWSSDLEGRSKKFVATGANPATYDGRLYCGMWENGEYRIAISD